MVGASDFEVEGGDGIIGSRDIGIEIGLGDILAEGFAPVFVASVLLAEHAQKGCWGICCTMSCEDGS